jgi:hypothetical protein
MVQQTRGKTGKQRWDRLFSYIRKLKGRTEMVGLRPYQCRVLSDLWHKASEEAGRWESFLETFYSFGEAWGLVEREEGQCEIDEAFAVSADRPVPDGLAELGTGPRRLAQLCAELQDRSGLDPFFLGCEESARLLNVRWGTSARWLRMLCGFGWLVRVKKGSSESGQASTYFWRELGD